MKLTCACLHCLSAFTPFPTIFQKVEYQDDHISVSIAFRHLPRSRLWTMKKAYIYIDKSPLPFGIYPVPDKTGEITKPRKGDGPSPLPFGIYAVPDQLVSASIEGASGGSPLPFGIYPVPDVVKTYTRPQKSYGLHCLSAFTPFPTLNLT